MSDNIFKICLTGGGTGGSVSPLLAIVDDLRARKQPDIKYDFYWLGTNSGPEKEMVAKEKIPFKAIAGGKLRRYFSWQNFLDPLKIIFGFGQSLLFLANWRPHLVISAGSYISVPVVWAGWILRIPVLIHQQDYEPGLANKLMAPFAKKITRQHPKTDFYFMSYYNPIFRYGVTRFIQTAKAAGIKGFIVPDLPLEEAGDFLRLCQQKKLNFIFVLAPNTTQERLKKILKNATGFVYCVARLGVTGKKTDINADLKSFI
ncbi:MAG: tryptophan synthase subunit alpha, partial [Planctomycetes bacterium]|nr:tryptophan synthase subunit alpha [Planctomycetota bacterium]